MPSRRNGLTRRALVAATVLGAGGSALAQRPPQPPRVKGPLVWLDMDQQDLDDAYDQLVYAPNRDYILKRCARNSELARERLGAPQLRLRRDADGGARRLHRQSPERSRERLRPRRRLAHGARHQLRLRGRDVRECWRAS